MPFNVPPVTGEIDALTRFLAQQQDAFRALAHGLTHRETSAAPSASDLSIGGLIRHVTSMQQSWLEMVLAAPQPVIAEATEPPVDYADGFRFDDRHTLQGVLAEFDTVSAAVLKAVADTDLDVSVPVPDAPWFPRDVDAWTVRWVWFHLLEELTRHAGQGDVIRETIDGATMFELMAAYEGMPDLGFLSPWSRSEAPFTTGVSTVATVISDPAAARAWYAELLGAEPYFDQGPYVEWRVGPYDRELGLLDASVTPDGIEPGTTITYWEVEDCAAAYAALLAQGATEHWAPMAYGGGYVGGSVRTPFGNIVGVMQRGQS